MRACAIDGCHRPHFAAGYCGPHYKRRWRYGDPLAGGKYQGLPMAERLRSLWHLDPTTGCWMWDGAQGGGYGAILVERVTKRAHRVTYETLVGPIPEGLELDHLCRTKLCVNPEHLEPVTHAENTRRHYGVTVTACPKGHEYTSSNTFYDQGRRRCRQCRNDGQNRRRRARLGEELARPT